MKRAILCAALLGLLGGAAAASEPSYLVRVQRVTDSDLALLRAEGLPVLTEMRFCLFLEANDHHLDWLRSHDYEARILDTDPSLRDYLLIGLRPDSDAAVVRGLGTVLLEEENWVLLRVAPGRSIEPLLDAKVFFSRLPREPAAIPKGGPQRGDESVSAGPDPLVQQIVDAVDTTTIDQYWADLTSNPPTGTRYSESQGCRDASAYCLATYANLGIPAEYQDYSPAQAPNVIGTIEGAVTPEQVYIVIGHLDDLPSSGLAPGADDNASGSVNVLESARAMACYAFRSTVKFLNVTGEELGLYGSEAYADDAELRGEDIRGVINMDMIGWEGDSSPDPENLDLDYNTPSQWLAQRFSDAAANYGTGLVVDPIYCPSLSVSDHWPFWQKGWSALTGITDNEGYCGHGGNYPYYHTVNDTIPNCGDPSFFYSVVKASVATLAELAEPFKITFDQPNYACDGPLRVVAGDRDLNTDPGVQETLAVNVWSSSEPLPETLILTEKGADSMIFEGTMLTTSEPAAPGDGKISVAPGDTISTEYTDALDCNGATGVNYAASAGVDCTSPGISGVTESDVTESQATITWITDEPADSTVVWGTGTPPGQTTSDAAPKTSHQILLTGLPECTVHYYEVRSADPAGNLATSDNGGFYYHFETLGTFGSEVRPCHEGDITIDSSVVSCSDLLTVRVVDLDLNLSIDEVDTTTVAVTSTTETVPEVLTLTETGVNTSRFAGSITTAPGAVVAGDGILQTAHGDLLTSTYRDADDGTGSPATAFATADADCAGPALATVRVTDVTDESAVVRWETSEPSSGRVEWGTTPALGSVASHSDLTTSHALTVLPLTECGRFYFRVDSTDTHGNTTTMDAGGTPFEFNAFTIPGAIMRDGFETSTGWTLEGEWQIGPPEGRGTSPGDPVTAFEDTTVLGHDLTGLGPHSGDYEPWTTESAISPVIDASTLSQVELKFRRWLNARAGATATVEVKQGSVWNIVWSSDDSLGVSDSAWSLQTLDITQYAAGNGSSQVAFRQFGGFGSQMNHAGWNVDRFIVRDGSLPPFDACGGCTGAPTFAGVAAAVDADPCAGTGITLSWEEAPAWGTGRPGTYAVYKDTQPGFTPSGANLVAAGITATTWTDTTAPNDVTLYYMVRAENDETCAAGPNNGGVTDSNDTVASARDEVTQPMPGGLGDALRVESINTAHLRLTWQPVTNAARYHIYRSDTPQGPFTRIGETAATLFDDDNELGNAFNRFYTVRAADACGNEGP